MGIISPQRKESLMLDLGNNRWFIGILLSALVGISFTCYAEIETQTAFSPDMLFQNAIKAGQLDDVRILIEKGEDVNKPFKDGVTPLHVAVINDQTNITAQLLQSGARVNATDSTTNATPLHMAALYGRTSIAELLIQNGADLNAKMKFDITPLLVASQFNQAKMVEILLDKKANINHADQEGYTALHFAAQNGDETITRLLLKHHANINALDKTKKATPLTVALENNHPDIAKILQENGGK